MLVLSRKVTEKIQIGDGITVTVVRLSNGGVRLGIEAPDGVSIVRNEVSGRRRDAGHADVFQKTL